MGSGGALASNKIIVCNYVHVSGEIVESPEISVQKYEFSGETCAQLKVS